MVNLFVVGALFAVAHMLPTGTMKYADLVGGALGGVTLSYLSYSGNGFIASPPRVRLALAGVVVGVTLGASMLVQAMVGGVVM